MGTGITSSPTLKYKAFAYFSVAAEIFNYFWGFSIEFEFTVFNPSSSSHFTHYQSMGTTRNSGAAVVFYQSGGIYEATSDIDAFKVFFNTGNISGTFKLYGIT